VLTSPSGLFVDIRVTSSSSPHAPLPLPAVSRELITSSTSAAKLDWAFAGLAETWTTEDGVHHCKWTHAVDSEIEDAESVEDEGVMEMRREKGVDGEVIEWVSFFLLTQFMSSSRLLSYVTQVPGPCLSRSHHLCLEEPVLHVLQ
jgi:hypothetical protein